MKKALKIILGVTAASIAFQIIWTVGHWLGFSLWTKGWGGLVHGTELLALLEAELWDVMLGPFYQSLWLTVLTLGLLLYGYIRYESYPRRKGEVVALLIVFAWVLWTFFKAWPSFYFETKPLTQYFVTKEHGKTLVIQPLINVRVSLILFQLFLVLFMQLSNDNN